MLGSSHVINSIQLHKILHLFEEGTSWEAKIINSLTKHPTYIVANQMGHKVVVLILSDAIDVCDGDPLHTCLLDVFSQPTLFTLMIQFHVFNSKCSKQNFKYKWLFYTDNKVY